MPFNKFIIHLEHESQIRKILSRQEYISEYADLSMNISILVLQENRNIKVKLKFEY